MTRDEFQALLNARGGLISEAVVVDPVIDNTDPITARLTPKIPNPNPTYEYVLKDGTHLKAKAVMAEDGTVDTNNIQITDPGTATAPPTAAQRRPTPSGQLDRLDAQGRLIPTDDTTTPAAKVRDPATGTVTDLPDPKTSPNGELKEFGDRLLRVMPDGTTTTIATKTAAAQAPTVHTAPDKSLIEYDPSKPAGQRVTTLAQAPREVRAAPTTVTRNGKAYEWDPSLNNGQGDWRPSNLPAEIPKPEVTAPSEIHWTDIEGTERQQGNRIVNGQLTPIEGLTRPKDEASTLIGNADSEYWTFLDKRGNIIRTERNPGYKPKPPTQLTADTISPNIPLLNADGTVTFVPNQNRVTNGQAMTDLLASAGVRVNNGELSMADAKDMLTGAVNAMNAQTSRQQAETAQGQLVRGAAGDILQATTQGAQTGAGMLNQRVSSAQGMLGSILGLAGQGQRSGNMGGGLMSVPAGLGEQLIGGIQGWTTELGGGPDVYATAANLVRRADPSNGTNPQAQLAYGVLGQMLERYQQITGQNHPLVIQDFDARDRASGQQQQPMAQPVVPAAAAPVPVPAVQNFASPPIYGPTTPIGNVPGPWYLGQFVSPPLPTFTIGAGGGRGGLLI